MTCSQLAGASRLALRDRAALWTPVHPAAARTAVRLIARGWRQGPKLREDHSLNVGESPHNLAVAHRSLTRPEVLPLAQLLNLLVQLEQLVARHLTDRLGLRDVLGAGRGRVSGRDGHHRDRQQDYGDCSPQLHSFSLSVHLVPFDQARAAVYGVFTRSSAIETAAVFCYGLQTGDARKSSSPWPSIRNEVGAAIDLALRTAEDVAQLQAARSVNEDNRGEEWDGVDIPGQLEVIGTPESALEPAPSETAQENSTAGKRVLPGPDDRGSPRSLPPLPLTL